MVVLFRGPMRELIEQIHVLEQYIRSHSTELTHSAPTRPVLSEDQAILQIQRFFRGYKIRMAMVRNRYDCYTSWILPEDETEALSKVMFDRHQTEADKREASSSRNPTATPRTTYHRVDEVIPRFTDLMDTFHVPVGVLLQHIIIPVIPLKTISIIDCLSAHPLYLASTVRWISDREDPTEPPSMLLLMLSKHSIGARDLEIFVRSMGVVASPWEVALKITGKSAARSKGREPSTGRIPQSILDKLSAIAHSPRHATARLAACMEKLLASTIQFRADATMRIARMLDFSNIFYEHNYARYAFCVYTVVHEISLLLIEQTDPETLKVEYRQFMEESKATLLRSLRLNESDLLSMQFIATPALSGTHAYAIALQLAQSIATPQPKVKIIAPFYYEHEYITLNKTDKLEEADILVTSAGPLFDGAAGLRPGANINLVIKHHIVDQSRTKHITIIVDATTALYNNISLEPWVIELIQQGRLSLIFYESHQKFGLLHTDQAQYGRLFGVCAKGHYPKEVLEALAYHSEEDFKKHPDLRIGAFISYTCGDLLESIKKDHFRNGALLRNALVLNTLVDNHILEHPDMLRNMNELYFLTTKERASLVGIEQRHSFGHFITTASEIGSKWRVSPDASDPVDTLIHTALLYLNHRQSPVLFDWVLGLEFVRAPGLLAIEDQILCVALLNTLLLHHATMVEMERDNPTQLFIVMSSLLNQCALLKGRHYYVLIQHYVFDLRTQLIHQFKPPHKGHFFSTLQVLYELSYKVTSSLVHQLCKYHEKCRAIHDLSLKTSRTELAERWRNAILEVLTSSEPLPFENRSFQLESSSALQVAVAAYHGEKFDFSLNTLSARKWLELKKILAAIPPEVKRLDCRWNGFVAFQPEELLELATVVPYTVSHIAWMDDHQMRYYLRRLLEDGEQANALSLFRRHEGQLTVFDEVAGRTLLWSAENDDTYGVFAFFFKPESDARLLQHIKAKHDFETKQLIHDRKLTAMYQLFEQSLFEWCKHYGLQSVIRELAQEHVITLLEHSEEEAHAFFRKESTIFSNPMELESLNRKYNLRKLLARDSQGDTILHRTAADDTQFLPIFERLKRSFKTELHSILSDKGNHGRSILYYAASNEKSLAAIFSVFRDDNERTLFLEEMTPRQLIADNLLHIAVVNPRCLQMLLNAYPEPTSYYNIRLKLAYQKNEAGERPIYLALAQPESLRILLLLHPTHYLFEELIDMRTGESLVRRALAYPESLRVIFEVCAPHPGDIGLLVIRQADRDGNTLLHLSVSNSTAFAVIMEQYAKRPRTLKKDLAICNLAGKSVQSLLDETDSIVAGQQEIRRRIQILMAQYDEKYCVSKKSSGDFSL